MSMDGQAAQWDRNNAENFNRLSGAHERYRRQTTDKRATTCENQPHDIYAVLKY